MNEEDHEFNECFFCKEPANWLKRIIYNNKENITFIYMPPWESAHLECYTTEIFRVTKEDE